MTYAEAIRICEVIDMDTIFLDGAVVDQNMRLCAIEKILSMETINAVSKDTLVKIIRWFWACCVDVEGGE